MTDAKIIRALECCTNTHLYTCDDCPFHKKCESDEDVLRYALDIITRQKAEIESLQKENNLFADLGKLYSEIKAEAIKEFWNELKSRNTMDERIVSVASGDNLVKEMAGDTK